MDDKYRLNIPRLNFLSKEKLDLIHSSTLEVLRRTGVQVDEPEAVEIFEEGWLLRRGRSSPHSCPSRGVGAQKHATSGLHV